MVLIVLFIINAVNQALKILDRIAVEGGAIDIKSVSDIAVRTDTASGSRMINLLLMLLLGCWLFGLVDAYLIGKNIDLAVKGRFKIPGDGRDA